MQNKRIIYLVYACDIWKSRDSERLLMATTSTRKVKAFISRKIEEEAFEYPWQDGQPRTPKAEAAQFRKDYDTHSMREINAILMYARIECTEDGEIL